MDNARKHGIRSHEDIDKSSKISVVIYKKTPISYIDRSLGKTVTYTKCYAMDTTGVVYKVIESQYKPILENDPEM